MPRSAHGLEEPDLALLHGLQIAPRVPWAEAGRILGVSAAALAARWERLTERGLAWVTAHPGGTFRHITMAMVEVDCLPGARAEVVAAVCADPRVVTVEESTRGRDLLLTVITADLPSLSRFVLDELETMPGVERQRTYLTTALHRHGGHWRLDALEPGQVTAFERVASRISCHHSGLTAGSGPLLAALAEDGRRTAAELARLTGRNPATVRRQLARIVGSDLVSFRCELAAEVAGWPVSTSWAALIAPGQHERTVTALASLPELRMCMSITGDANIMLTTWTRTVHDLLRIERFFGEQLSWMRLRDSAINLRTPKRMGWILDPDGRATGEVVVPNALEGR